MTSSQPVVTPNALNFTPDNKHAYIYSGKVVVTNSTKTLLEFSTNSEYLVATVSFNYDTTLGGSNNYDFSMSFNNNEIYKIELDSPQSGAQRPAIQMRKIIIPPFTDVLITAINLNADANHDCYASVTGSAFGMSETEYQ